MKINFNEMQGKVMPEFKGGKGSMNVKMHADDLMKIMMNSLPSGSTVGTHTHETSSEVIYILSGSGKAFCDGMEEKLEAGDCHYCPKGHYHNLVNDGLEDLVFLAVVPEQQY